MPNNKKAKSKNPNQLNLQRRLSDDLVIQDQLAVFDMLPNELILTICETLSSQEIAFLGSCNSHLLNASQGHFKALTEKLVADNFWDSKEADELGKNPRDFFNKILLKIFTQLSAKSRLELKLVHAYLIILIKYESEKNLEDFVKSNLKNKSINFALTTEKNKKSPYNIAIDLKSLEKLTILLRHSNSKHTKIIPLIRYAIKENSLEIARFLWNELNEPLNLLLPSNNEINIFNLVKERTLLQTEFILQAFELKHLDILLYFLRLLDDVTLPLSENALLQMIKIAFACKHHETVEFLLMSVPNFKNNFENIYMISAAAVLYDYTDIAMEFIPLLENYQNDPEFKESINLMLQVILLNNSTLTVLPMILQKFYKYITPENLAKAFELAAEKNLKPLMELFFKQPLFYETMGKICLCIALKKNNLELFNGLYNDPPNQCGSVYDKTTLIIYAIRGNFATIVVDLAKRVKLTATNPANDPLLVAIECGNLPIVKIILEHKALVTMECLDAAIAAKKPAILQLLINSWSDENSINFPQLLYAAVAEKDLACLKILVSAGADPDTLIIEEEDAQFIWSIAAEAGQWDMVKYLLSLSVLLKNPKKVSELSELPTENIAESLYNILIAAANANQDEVVLLLLPYVTDRIDEEKNTLLHLLAKTNCLESIKSLYAKNKTLKYNSFGHTPFHSAVINGYPEVVAYFIEQGCDVNLNDGHKLSPLFSALLKGNMETIELLIKKGANLNNENYMLCVPIKNSAENNKNSMANAMVFDNYYLALKYLNNINILNLIIEREPTLSLFRQDKTPPSELQLLYNAQTGDFEKFSELLNLYKININFATPKGETFLTKAIKFGQFKFVQKLLDLGVSVNGVNPNRPVVIAANNQQWEILYYLIEEANALSNYTEEQLQELYNLVLGPLGEDLASHDISAEESTVSEEKYRQQNKVLEAIDHLLKQQTKEKKSSSSPGFWPVVKDEDQDPLRRTRKVAATPTKETKKTIDNSGPQP